MGIYESFPEQKPRDLTIEELRRFAATQVFAAARHIWGEDFDDPAKLEDNEPVSRLIESEVAGDDSRVEVDMYVDADFALDDDGDKDESVPPDLYVGVSLSVFRADITKRLQRQQRDFDHEVWQVTTFEFPVSTEEEWGLANRYYALCEVGDTDEVSPDDLTPRQRKFLEKVSNNSQYDPDRSIEINTQDTLDISNILLALEIPERVIGLAW